MAVVAIGNAHLLLLSNECVWGKGENKDGELGTGDTEPRHELAQLQLPINARISYVAAGQKHSIILDETGVAYGFGSNVFGECGSTWDTETILVPCAIAASGPLKKVFCGSNFTILWKQDGGVLACGNNLHGKLGTGARQQNIILPVSGLPVEMIEEIQVGHDHCLYLDDKGFVWAVGLNSHGQLGLGHSNPVSVPTKIKTLKDIKFISSGYNHNFAADSQNRYWVWGSNACGQLTALSLLQKMGISNGGNVETPKKIKGFTADKYRACAAGACSFLIEHDTGSVLGLGQNYYGRHSED
jgi:alpha-tubulin suppressor-like RCC1 family protein